MSRLLNKPLKWFAFYALLLLAASIPVYYYVVESIWFEELDEKNWIAVERIQRGLENQDPKDNDFQKILAFWTKLQPGTKMFPISKEDVNETKVFTAKIYDPFEEEVDRYRVLTSVIWVQDKPYSIRVSTNLQESNETIASIAFVTGFFFLALIIGFSIINFFISKRSWQPFYSTLKQLKQFDLNKDQNFVLEKTKIREFNELNTEIIELIHKNMLVYDQQKRFIENASHELQTPLAILKIKVDTLLQNEQLEEQHAELLETMSANISRISRINKNLLLLSKIENQQFNNEEQVEISDVISETVAHLEDYATAKNSSIHKNLSQIKINCNRTLLEILINNLVVNAIRHGQENDKIQIELNERALKITNSGITSLEEQQLFVRFAISSSEKTSSGLGLAIVKEICDRYNWRYWYTFSEKKHCFAIEF